MFLLKKETQPGTGGWRFTITVVKRSPRSASFLLLLDQAFRPTHQRFLALECLLFLRPIESRHGCFNCEGQGHFFTPFLSVSILLSREPAEAVQLIRPRLLHRSDESNFQLTLFEAIFNLLKYFANILDRRVRRTRLDLKRRSVREFSK